jgi:predicted Ser/Thr protein kinase
MRPSGFVPPEPAELAKQFLQLDIIELLGQGGMGAVYKARQRELDRLVALKILPPQAGQTEAFAERFTREARSLAKLNHPHIVTVYDFGRTAEGLYYFIMEFVDGTDLRQAIRAGNIEPAEALAIVPQVCEALQYAHEEGIVHRDIKPENILLDRKGRVKIADFGLAKLLDRPPTAYTLTQAQQRMGTTHYMAPEQIEHPHDVDHRADIYSLGVVFYEMLTGQLPIGRFAPPSQKVQVDVRLDEVVLKSLEHEPERRYQHASEIKTDVETIGAADMPDTTAGLGPKPDSREINLFGIGIGEHVRLAAIIRIVWGSVGLFGAALVLALFLGPPLIEGDRKALAILSAFGIPIVMLLVVFGGSNIIAGIGLLKRRPWVKTLVLVMAFLDVAAVPIGTAFGIYTIWVVMKAKAAGLLVPSVPPSV